MTGPEVLNAINGEMRDGLNAAWARFRDDQEAWVAIVTGAGRAFCAGADLKDGAGSVGTWSGTFWEIPTLNSFESGWEIFKPTIAAVNGPCIGYGLTAAAACDFLIAAESATFAFPEVRIGVPTIVGALRLPAEAGLAARHGAAAARASPSTPPGPSRSAWPGRSCPTTSCSTKPGTSPTRLCRGAPLAQRAVKEVAMRGAELPWLDAVRFGETMRRVAGATEDAQEGRRAAAEGRDPDWKGR